jgi:hypothetical protein
MTLKQRISSFFLSLMAASLTFGIAAIPLTVHAATAKKSVVQKKTATKTSRAKRVTVSSVPGKDEKEFSVSTSRCLTKDMKALHEAMIKRMEADIHKAGDGYDDAVTAYRSNINIIWSAMEEPYCGYGSRGMTAVKRSYQKSVERTRATFLAAVKK